MEEWNARMLEYWGYGRKYTILIVKNSFKPIIPLLHYSTIPIGEKP